MKNFRICLETAIALTYLAFGALWILFSDRLVESLVSNRLTLTQAQTYKGWLFVSASALLIFGLLRQSLRKERLAQAELVQKQKQVEQAERQYRLLFESSPLPMWIYDPQTLRFLAVNQMAQEKYGYSKEEFLTMQITAIRPQEEVAKLLDVIHAQRDKYRRSGPWQHITKSGQVRYVEIFAHEIEYFGKPARMVMVNDISEQKQAEDALRESEARYRRLTENAPDLIYRYEFVPERRFTYVNPAAISITGYTPEEHYADPDLGVKLVVPEDRPLLEQATNRNRFDKPLVLRWRRKDGSILWTEQRNVPVYDQEGNLIALEGIARDITERKQTEEALQKISLRLAEVQETERLNLSKELHDQVGQSLTALGINLNLLRVRCAHEIPAELFNSALDLLQEVTDKIRDIMAELHPPVLENYGLVAALHWLAERLHRQTGLEVKIYGGLIEPRLPLVTAASLFYVVREALNNVIKHANVEQARVFLEANPKQVLLRIEDDGQGFTPEPLFIDGNVHWGLTTMRERIELLRGNFQIQSAPGQGTKIFITVPREL